MNILASIIGISSKDWAVPIVGRAADAESRSDSNFAECEMVYVSIQLVFLFNITFADY